MFSLVTQRHFAKVLNSIDVGIAGDRLESSLLLLKALYLPTVSLCTVLLLRIGGCDLEYFCCPVWMVCWSFSVFRDGVLSFSVSVLCQSLSCSTDVHCWTMLISRGIRFGTFRCLTVISVVHMDAYMLTLRCSCWKFFVCMSCHDMFLKQNDGNETSETPVFPNLKFCFVIFGMLLM